MSNEQKILDILENTDSNKMVVIEKGQSIGKSASFISDKMYKHYGSIGIASQLHTMGLSILATTTKDHEVAVIQERVKQELKPPKPIKYKLHNHDVTKIYPFQIELINPHKNVRGKSHYKKHHKPNTGLKLGSYKYKSR